MVNCIKCHHVWLKNMWNIGLQKDFDIYCDARLCCMLQTQGCCRRRQFKTFLVLHHLYDANAADIKTMIVFLSGNRQNDVRLCLSPIIRCSIICMLHKSVRSQLALLFQSGMVHHWQTTDCLYVVPTTNWTSRVRQKHCCSPPTQRVGAGWTSTITAFLQIIYSFLRPPTHESVLVSIATCLLPPWFDVLSSPSVLYNKPVYSTHEGEKVPLLSK